MPPGVPTTKNVTFFVEIQIEDHNLLACGRTFRQEVLACKMSGADDGSKAGLESAFSLDCYQPLIPCGSILWKAVTSRRGALYNAASGHCQVIFMNLVDSEIGQCENGRLWKQSVSISAVRSGGRLEKLVFSFPSFPSSTCTNFERGEVCYCSRGIEQE